MPDKDDTILDPQHAPESPGEPPASEPKGALVEIAPVETDAPAVVDATIAQEAAKRDLKDLAEADQLRMRATGDESLPVFATTDAGHMAPGYMSTPVAPALIKR